jgi:hypothetical protein
VEDYVLDKSTRGIYKPRDGGRYFHFLPSSEREARMDDPRGPTPFSVNYPFLLFFVDALWMPLDRGCA